MTAAARDWTVDSFVVSGLRFEPRVIQRDRGTSIEYEIECVVHRDTDEDARIHRTEQKVDTADDVNEHLEPLVERTVDTALLMAHFEEEITSAFEAAVDDYDEADITLSSLGVVRLHDNKQGYTIHMDGEAVKQPDGFIFSASGWLGSDESDSIIFQTDEVKVETIEEIESEIAQVYSTLIDKRDERIAALNTVQQCVDQFSPRIRYEE